MIVTVGTLLGGLGIFLLAISMITDGLKLAAGDKLKQILERWTTTRLRGVASGILVTAVVQSSSAVTVATIGFVNAGLLTLGRALGVIYGANIGTTMTGWIVAAIGFSFRVEALALPLVGLGMFARLLRPNTRLAEIGGALAGFGLFFIAIDLMRDAFEAFAGTLELGAIAPLGVGGILLYVAFGALMTVLTQSSSAAIAITLTAATGGVLGIDAAAAMVIGANVGTTSTAAFAVIGATANARRVAAAHVIFNLVTGAVALLLLPVMLWVVRVTGTVLGLADIPAVSLALFHTVFNLLGVLLMWPVTTRLAAFLGRRFTTQAERLSRPQYLDSNVLATPALALRALDLELVRALATARALVIHALDASGAPDRSRRDRAAALAALLDETLAFVSNLEATKLPEDLKGNIPMALRVTGYLEETAGLLADFEQGRPDVEAILQPGVANAVADFRRRIAAQVERCDPESADFASANLEDGYRETRERWHDLKSVLLEAAAERTVPIGRVNAALESLRTTLRISEQLTKCALRLHELIRRDAAPAAPADTADAAAEAPGSEVPETETPEPSREARARDGQPGTEAPEPADGDAAAIGPSGPPEDHPGEDAAPGREHGVEEVIKGRTS